MDLLCKLLSTRPGQTDWEFAIEQYMSRCFGYLGNQQCRFANCTVWTWSRTWSDGPEPLLTICRSRCRCAQIVAQYTFRINDGQTSMFGTVFNLQILQQCLLMLGSISSLVLRTDINSHVPLPEQSQLQDRIEKVCWNVNHSHSWSNLSRIYGQLLSCTLHSEV